MTELFPGYMTLILLVAGIVIFSLLSIESRKIRSFQFQISVFIVIWILGEVADILQDEQIIGTVFTQDVGIKIHLAAMIFFCGMVLMRFYQARKSKKKLLDEIQD